MPCVVLKNTHPNYQPTHDTCFCLGVGKQSDDLLGTSLELFTPHRKNNECTLTRGHFKRKIACLPTTTLQGMYPTSGTETSSSKGLGRGIWYVSSQGGYIFQGTLVHFRVSTPFHVVDSATPKAAISSATLPIRFPSRRTGEKELGRLEFLTNET